MNILIAGSEGYIGTVMADYFLQKGHTVVGLDTGFFRGAWLYNGAQRLPSVIAKDTRTLTVDDLKGYNCVIALADLSNDPMGQLDRANTLDINFRGVTHLARLAREAGVERFIYSSSCSAYGIASQGLVNEESPTHPQTAYAECKVLCEQELKKLAGTAFSPVFLRNATVYGPSPRLRFDLVVNNLSGVAWCEKTIKLTSDGTPWRPLVHIMDVVEAFYAAALAPKHIIHNQIFNVGNSSNNYQMGEVAGIIAKVFPGCTVTKGQSDGDTRSYRVDFSKINSLLPGYKSKRTVEEGAHELKAIFEKVQLTSAMFTDKSYTRLKQLTYLKTTRQVDAQLFWTPIL